MLLCDNKNDRNGWNDWIPLTNSTAYKCAMSLTRKLGRGGHRGNELKALARKNFKTSPFEAITFAFRLYAKFYRVADCPDSRNTTVVAYFIDYEFITQLGEEFPQIVRLRFFQAPITNSRNTEHKTQVHVSRIPCVNFPQNLAGQTADPPRLYGPV